MKVCLGRQGQILYASLKNPFFILWTVKDFKRGKAWSHLYFVKLLWVIGTRDWRLGLCSGLETMKTIP